MDRRWWWVCACGAPYSWGMRKGGQYPGFDSAEAARAAHQGRCGQWSVIVECPRRPAVAP